MNVARRLSVRVVQADYIYARHNFGVHDAKSVDHGRLSTGLMFLVP